MVNRIQIRRGTAAAWVAADPVLAVGERGFETDTGLSKTGDGATAWTALAYEGVADAPLAAAVGTGATVAALNATYGRGTVSVNSFAGVDKTGVTDSTDAINAGIAALPDDVRTVHFEQGTYMAAIRVTKPNVTLTGSWTATIKTPSNATSHVNDACVRILADGVTIENLTLDGNKSGNAALDDFNLGRWADGVGIYANRATVRNCRIKDTIGHKVIVWNESFDPTTTLKGARSHFAIEGNHITGVGQRASIDVASTDVTTGVNNNGIIRGNFVEDMVIIVHTGEDLLIDGNVVRDVTKASSGISVHTNSKRVRVVNNIIGPCSIGLSTSNNCEDITFAGNQIYDTAGTGIHAENGSRIAVDGNSVRTTGASSPGINFTTVAGGSIRNNTVSASGTHALSCGTTTTDVLIAGNKTFAPGQYHVSLSTVSDIAVRGNSFKSGGIGVAATSGTNSGLVIEGNDITGTSLNGIYTTAPDVLIRGNTVRFAGAHAIRVQGQGSRVIGNEVRDTTGIAIYLAAAVTGVVITDNRIVTASGGMIAGQQADTVIRRNIGYVTEARGTDTVIDTAASRTVTHGLAVAPTSVTLTPRANEAIWVSARSSTTFVVSRVGTTGALAFDWQAEV